MNVGIIGNGGREAALEYFLKRSAFVGSVRRLEGLPDNPELILRHATTASIALTVVGPEAYLAEGIVNLFRSAGKCIVGPTKQASRIETSKIFCKKLLRSKGIPTADFTVFSHPDENTLKKGVQALLKDMKIPLVIKADGLASGKGVSIARTQEQAVDAVDRIIHHGDGRILVEEYLEGKECSFMVLTDGKHALALLAARDYKEAYPGGPMTGGMGCIAPIPEMTDRLQKEILTTIIYPALKGLEEHGSPFQGILYAGLMLTRQGPKVLEFNCRLGDPETQTILPLMGSDLFPFLHATTTNTISHRSIAWRNESAVCVVLASRGYPGISDVGFPISGLEKASAMEGVRIFHAATSQQADGSYITSGGRVLNVVGLGQSLAEARERAYKAVGCISFEGMWYREDIGL